MELSPHSLTTCNKHQAFGVWLGCRDCSQYNPFSSSTSWFLASASTKAISERTSYSQIRLAFHSLPQLIPRRCTTYGFGPPSVFRQTSPCSWQAHLASGRIYPTNALFTLGFP